MRVPVDQDLIAFPEPTNAEWLNVATSAFEFWDNPLDAEYDDLLEIGVSCKAYKPPTF